MPPTNRIAFVRDFFFTDIMNHLEFLKWTGGLEKDDDVLLVHILERLVAGSDDATVVTPMVDPFYASLVPHRAVPKNPLHIAIAYAQIQRLSGHEYNVFEYAFLDPTSYWLRALLAFAIQNGFFACLVVYNLVEQRIEVTPGEDGFFLVVIILFMSSILLFSEVRRQRNDAHDFNSVMMRFQQHYHDRHSDRSHPFRSIWLHMNYWINGFLGLLIFTFNTYFILVSDNPTEAVLNSVALAFIIEIDDIFKPNWNEENKEDALAELLHPYISEPVANESAYVTVTTVRATPPEQQNGQHQHSPKASELTTTNKADSERSNGSKSGRERPYQHMHQPPTPAVPPPLWPWNGRGTDSNDGDTEEDDDDVNLYCHVGAFEEDTDSFTVHVYVADDRVQTRYGPVTTSYEPIDYFVTGPRAKELFDALNEFHCLENFHDIVHSSPRLVETPKQLVHEGTGEQEQLLKPTKK